MQKLTTYLKAQGAVKASIVSGPNGKFISATKADNSVITLPVGKRSQNGRLDEFNVLIAADTNQPIATVNHYEEVETVTL